MPDSDRPNILVILSDTHAATALSGYGSPIARTPCLDRLAAEGVAFDAAYCQNPLCVPSRQSLITGKRSFQTGVIHNDMAMPPMRTIAHLLRENGYDTAAIGKMHFVPDTEFSLGKERHFGFDRRLDYEEFYWYLRRERGAPALAGFPDDPWRLVHLERMQHDLQEPLARPSGAPARGKRASGVLPFEDHQEALVLREWREYLREGHARPFLAFVSFQSPHPPSLPTQELFDEMALIDIPLPPSPDENAANHPFLGGPRKTAPDAHRLHYLRHYFAFVRFTDFCAGQALQILDESGYRENTLVLYASDHGDMLYEHGMTGKMVHYENSVRVPLIARWPGRIPAGWRYKGLVELLDLFPTLREAAGIEPEEPEEGRSLLPDLFARRDPGKPAVFAEAYPMQRNRARFGDWPHRMVRERDWKYIQYGPEREDLFCLADDPGETANLAAKAPEEAKRLRDLVNTALGPMPQPEARLMSGGYAS